MTGGAAESAQRLGKTAMTLHCWSELLAEDDFPGQGEPPFSFSGFASLRGVESPHPFR